MEEQILQKIAELEKKVDALYVSAETTRKYFKWTFYITILTVVLPALGLLIVIPYYLHTLQSVDFTNIGL